jgi:pyruvate dehydrogenase E2 component (dihydrolipoamide acetyltransferase)
VVRGADQRSLLDLAREIERLASDAKAGRARPEDQGNSTFTITSLGALGGLFATPVLNFPEVGILGLHRIRPTPVVRDGQVVVRDVMHVSVTSDHRVVDGHEAAAFCYEVIKYLEDPGLLFMRMV